MSNGAYFKGWRPLLAGVVALLLVGGLYFLIKPATTASPGQEDGEAKPEVAARIGALAPDFSLDSLEGGKVSLSDFRGQPVLLNFWASWCGPCRAEMPEMQRLKEEHAADGLVVLVVNAGEDEGAAQRFLDSLGLDFEVGLDRDLSVTREYRVLGLPASFFIDREGIVRELFPGRMDMALMEKKLKSIL
jgi:thiol-disulfide isomerase/thioredoxin